MSLPNLTACRKVLAILLSVSFLAGQGFAAPIEAALRRDAARFNRLEAARAQQNAAKVALDGPALKRLEDFNKKTNASWRIRLNKGDGSPRSLVGGRNLRAGRSESSALSFLNQNRDFLGVDRRALRLKLQRRSAIGNHFYFEQYYKNIPVEGAYVKVSANTAGELINYQSTYVRGIDIDSEPKSAPGAAAQIAAGDAGGLAQSAPALVVYKDGASAPQLAWKVTAQGGLQEPGKWVYYIADNDGKILNRVSALMYAQETMQARLNPLYPGATVDAGLVADTDANRPAMPLPDMQVYYFANGAQNAVTAAVTDANGQVNVTRSGRLYTVFNGKYFSVTNQRNTSNSASQNGLYIEAGLDDDAEAPNPKIESIDMLWDPFSPSADNTYLACEDAGHYNFLSAPIIKGMDVGAMDIGGVITDKVFLQFASSAATAGGAGQILAKYIGRPNRDFLGPLVANQTTTQYLTPAVVPAGSKGVYNTMEWTRLCAPPAFSTGYSPLTTHEVATKGVNEAEANAYYNLNAARGFFVKLNTGGYIDLDTSLPVVVNAHGAPYSDNGNHGMPNAFYDVDQKVIMYGEGYYGRSFALESAVVRHEYVHAVMDRIWPIYYQGEGAAVSEALADYFALSSLVKPDGSPYTAKIGAYVATANSTGVGSVRDLANNSTQDGHYDPVRWVQNDNYKNSLVLSRALWGLRAGGYSLPVGHADKIIWNAMMFFPDSLLEMRDAVLAAAQALGYSADIPAIEDAFDFHGINYQNIITANGDIYELNNSPDSAADIDAGALSARELFGSVNPVSDYDYYSISLPPGDFSATLHLPTVPGRDPVEYYPLAMILLDANLKTVVKITSPTDMTGGQNEETVFSSSVTLKYAVPERAKGGTGRYILGVFKPADGAYPKPDDVTATTGQYRLQISHAKGSNIGAVETNTPDFSDGVTLNFEAPIHETYPAAGPIPAELSLDDWAPNRVEAYAFARLLDEDLNPIDDADTLTATYLQQVGDVQYDDAGKIITGSVQFGGGFADLGHDLVHLQVFGKLRSNAALAGQPAPQPEDETYRQEYGLVSLGISNPIRNRVRAATGVYIRTAVFNPAKGGEAKFEINAQKDGQATAVVYTVDGILVKKLFDGYLTPLMGEIVEWDGKNESGATVASGVYLLRITSAGETTLKKLVVVK